MLALSARKVRGSPRALTTPAAPLLMSSQIERWTLSPLRSLTVVSAAARWIAPPCWMAAPCWIVCVSSWAIS